MKKAFLLILGYFGLQCISVAQTTIPVEDQLLKDGYFGPTKSIVKMDPVSGIPIGNIPFDRNFILRIYFLNEGDFPRKAYIVDAFKKSVQLYFYEDKIAGEKYDKTDLNLLAFPYAIDILMPPLLPNKKYEVYLVSGQKEVHVLEYLSIFKLIYDKKEKDAESKHKQYRGAAGSSNVPTYRELSLYYTQQKLGDIFQKYGGNLNWAAKELTERMKTVDYYTENSIQIKLFQDVVPAGNLSTMQYTVQTDASLHIVGEGGVLFTGFQKNFNVATGYVGINVSFRPLDSDLPISMLAKNQQISFWQRFTANLGITLNSIAKTGYRSNLFGNDNIMLGLGYKFNHYISLIAGGLIYNNNDANPLLDKKTVGVAPYVGLSVNLKIKDALGEVSKLFTYGK